MARTGFPRSALLNWEHADCLILPKHGQILKLGKLRNVILIAPWIRWKWCIVKISKECNKLPSVGHKQNAVTSAALFSKVWWIVRRIIPIADHVRKAIALLPRALRNFNSCKNPSDVHRRGFDLCRLNFEIQVFKV